jgi:hypothetical protein
VHPPRRVSALCISVLSCAALIVSSASAARVNGSVTGAITYLGGNSVTIQTNGRPLGMINALTAAANRLSAEAYPYVWGGGHAAAGVPSIGERGGRGFNGKRIGYDCSGAVAAVLAGAGLWPAGSEVPNDAYMITALLDEGLIARGPGTAPNEVTLYDRPGVHIFMNIDGRFFGTTDGGAGDPKGEATWLDDGAPDSFKHVFRRYHFLPSVLHNKTTYGHSYTFVTGELPSLLYGAEIGDKITVRYREAKPGSMAATRVAYAGAVTVTGTVVSIAADGSSVTVQAGDGRAVSLATSLVSQLLEGVQVGDEVKATYARDRLGALVPHALTIVAPATTPAP